MLVLFPFYLVVRFIFLKRTRKKIILTHEAVLAIFVIYVVGLASQTVIPYWSMGINSLTGEFYFLLNLSPENTHVNLLPFHTIQEYINGSNPNVDEWESVSLLNIMANILLFSPMGFFLSLFLNKKSLFIRVLMIGFLITCSIEVIQFFIGRSTDIDDVILNTIGIMIGYWMFLLCSLVIVKPLLKKRIKSDDELENTFLNMED